MKEKINHILHGLFPMSCLFCKGVTRELSQLCPECLHELPWLEKGCHICSKPLFANKNKVTTYCGDCLNNPPFFDVTLVPFIYESPINILITQLKFNQKLRYATVLSQLMLSILTRHYKNNKLPECIIPVPLHRIRLRKRGFNQAVEIAKLLGKYFSIPLQIKYCKRTRSTVAQTSIDSKKRYENVKNAFSLSKSLKYTHVAIIDDVITTGSTVNELSKVLRKEGVEKIEIWCAGRAV